MKDAFLYWGQKAGGGCNCTHHLQADTLQFLFVSFKEMMKSLVCSSGFSGRN